MCGIINIPIIIMELYNQAVPAPKETRVFISELPGFNLTRNPFKIELPAPNSTQVVKIKAIVFRSMSGTASIKGKKWGIVKTKTIAAAKIDIREK